MKKERRERKRKQRGQKSRSKRKTEQRVSQSPRRKRDLLDVVGLEFRVADRGLEKDMGLSSFGLLFKRGLQEVDPLGRICDNRLRDETKRTHHQHHRQKTQRERERERNRGIA